MNQSVEEALLETADGEILGMPLHAEHPGSIDQLDSLSDARMVARDHPESLPEVLDRLTVKTIDPNLLGAQEEA